MGSISRNAESKGITLCTHSGADGDAKKGELTSELQENHISGADLVCHQILVLESEEET